MPFDSLAPFPETETQVTKDLRAALELLGPNGENWCQHAAKIGGRFCMVGAMLEVEAGEAATTALYRVMGGSVVDFNDAPGRDFSDVRSAFERAIANSMRETR